MLENMNLWKRLALGFSFVILILLAMAVFSIVAMQKLSETTEALYRHPFTVSTSILKVKNKILDMDSLLKDIVHTASQTEITQHVKLISEYEQTVISNFDILNERFLGDKSKIEELKNEVANWTNIRDDIIAAVRSGQPEKAKQIADSEGKHQVKLLFKELDYFENFAFDKAKTFRNNAAVKGEESIRMQLLLALFGVVLACMVSFIITRSVIRPIGGEPKEIEKLVQYVANGQLDIQFDEHKDSRGIYLAMQTMVSKLREIFEQLKVTAHSQATAAEELSTTTLQTQNNVAVQSSSISEATDLMQEMQETAANVSALANEAGSSIENANGHVNQGLKQVKRTTKDIQGLAVNLENTSQHITMLAESTKDISGILGVIKGIADQTNLLALNAAIEAARAGEHGRGFAVVADEVRALASNTQASTAEIEDKISNLQEGVVASVNLMKDGCEQSELIVSQASTVQQALNEIEGAIKVVVSNNLKITEATQVQNNMAEQVSAKLTEIQSLSCENGSGAKQISEASEELALSASGLNEQFKKFTL